MKKTTKIYLAMTVVVIVGAGMLHVGAQTYVFNPQVIASINVPPYSTGSIAKTTFFQCTTAGLYRISQFQEITHAETGSSPSINYTFWLYWTDAISINQQTGGAIGNSGNSAGYIVDNVFVIYCAPPNPVQYSVTWSSTPTGNMTYELNLRAEGPL